MSTNFIDDNNIDYTEVHKDAEKNEANNAATYKANDEPESKGSALVFGASGQQGLAVIDGLLDSGYSPVYGATRDLTSAAAISASARGAVMMEVDLENLESVETALFASSAPYIFLVTTTDMPPNSKTFKEAEDKEYDAIISFFDILVAVHEKDKIDRHIVFSSMDNVMAMREELAASGTDIEPLEDGSVVAHFSGKARAGEYALEKLKSVPGVFLTIVTLPFLHSYLMTWAIPLPDEGRTQWTISAALGHGPIDMFSIFDLPFIVRAIFEDRKLYNGFNLRVSGEKITMTEVANTFSKLFGRDVIYNPLTVPEMAALSIPAADCMAQMCQFLSCSHSDHDIAATEAIMFPRKTQLLKDWILINSDNPAFDTVGLAVDPSPILTVAVFGATAPQGKSVVKGLLADGRKTYKIIATSRNIEQPKAKEIKELDTERVTLVQCDFENVESCKAALKGADGVFLTTDYYEGAGADPYIEEGHAINVIDACEDSSSVKHLVFSTLESVEEMNRKMDLGLPEQEDEHGRMSVIPEFDAKARAAAYARTKMLSCTYVLMPYYMEKLMDLLAPEEVTNEDTGDDELVMTIPANQDDLKLMLMSVDELGPAVANIFDAYQVYAGHEIGLVTDYVTVCEAADTIVETLYSEKDSEGNVKSHTVKKKITTKETWLENRGTVTKDLGQIFKYYSKSDAVKKRRSVAKTLQLCPDAKPMQTWLEDNKQDASFRQKMGIR